MSRNSCDGQMLGRMGRSYRYHRKQDESCCGSLFGAVWGIYQCIDNARVES